MVGPYRQYVLTYEGTDASQGNEVTSTPNPTTGSPCDYPVTRYQPRQVGEPTCSGNPRFDDFNHDPSVNPGTGLLSVSQSQVTHRRVIHGKVSSDPANARSGSGTDPPSDANAGTQKAWSFSTRLNATVTLAPGTKAR